MTKLMRNLGTIMRVDPLFLDAPVDEAATLPFSLGGQSGHFGPVSLLIGPAFLIAWQWSRHGTPLSLPESLGELGRFTLVACLGDVQVCALALGCIVVSLADGARPVLARRDVQDQPRCGWEREVSLKVEQHFRDTRLLPTMTERDQALLRSQGGPLAAAPFTSCPTDKLFRIEPQCFRVLLFRRSSPPTPTQLQVWPSTRRPWPPPCSLRNGRGVGSAGLRRGECGGSHMP